MAAVPRSSRTEQVQAAWSLGLRQPFLCGFSLLTLLFVITWLGGRKPSVVSAHSGFVAGPVPTPGPASWWPMAPNQGQVRHGRPFHMESVH